ncbi:MAG TPA: RNA-binding S4 domain-containing protein [Firmicutes bacterium]|jgi:ribosome-associated protein|nr:RNA-binding S4 domain-containing protein [Bacillota bacterium]
MEDIVVQGTIRLDQFLKLAGLVLSGGEAKTLIQAGMVKVNGRTERRRGFQLKDGDRVLMPDSTCWQVRVKGE